MTTSLQVDRPDGARLHVEVAGQDEAPVLVLLQGQASSSTWWADLGPRYAERFRAVTMDYRGTGSTVAPGEAWSTSLLADDVAAVLDALDVEQAHVYGTSMGGRVAQMLATRHLQRVASLVLAATSPGGPHAVERSAEVRRELADPDEARRQAALVRLFYTPAWGGDASQSRLLGDLSMTPADRQRHLRMSARHDAWDLLSSISTPVLVLHGSDDEMTPPVNASLLAEQLPHARLHVHQGGRHGFFDEFADDIDPMLDRFWASVGV